MTLKRLVELMFYLSAYLIVLMIGLPQFIDVFKTLKIEGIYMEVFCFVLGFLLASAIVFQKLKFKTHVNSQDKNKTGGNL